MPKGIRVGDGQEIYVAEVDFADKIHEIFFREIVASAMAGVSDLRKTLNFLVQDPRVHAVLTEIYEEDAIQAFQDEWERSQ